MDFDPVSIAAYVSILQIKIKMLNACCTFSRILGETTAWILIFATGPYRESHKEPRQKQRDVGGRPPRYLREGTVRLASETRQGTEMKYDNNSYRDIFIIRLLRERNGRMREIMAKLLCGLAENSPTQ